MVFVIFSLFAGKQQLLTAGQMLEKIKLRIFSQRLKQPMLAKFKMNWLRLSLFFIFSFFDNKTATDR